MKNLITQSTSRSNSSCAFSCEVETICGKSISVTLHSSSTCNHTLSTFQSLASEVRRSDMQDRCQGSMSPGKAAAKKLCSPIIMLQAPQKSQPQNFQTINSKQMQTNNILLLKEKRNSSDFPLQGKTPYVKRYSEDRIPNFCTRMLNSLKSQCTRPLDASCAMMSISCPYTCPGLISSRTCDHGESPTLSGDVIHPATNPSELLRVRCGSQPKARHFACKIPDTTP